MRWRSPAVAVLLLLSLAAFAQVELPRVTEVLEVRVTIIASSIGRRSRNRAVSASATRFRSCVAVEMLSKKMTMCRGGRSLATGCGATVVVAVASSRGRTGAAAISEKFVIS